MKTFFAVDGSPESLAAVRQVGQLLSPTKDAAILYFAPPEVFIRYTTKLQETHDCAMSAITTAVFNEATRFLPEPLMSNVKTVVASELPREGIIAQAKQCGADLIVVGARGMSRVDRFLLGSVSKSVVHHSETPVFVSRPAKQRLPGQPLRVLFAYDGSESSLSALAAAERLSFPSGTEVIAATVVEAPAADLPAWVAQARRSPETEAVVEQWRREMENDKREAGERLASLMQKQPAPFARAEIVLAEGHAAEQLLKLAEARHVDLVVIGSGGKGPLSRLLLGSTSEKVLTYAPCSVLVARAAKPDAA